MKAYKGFNKDMTCRGFQYAEGETYKTDKAKVCECGFHACKHPLDVLGFYSPNNSVYHEVEVGGKIDDSDENNVAATEIKIGARLTIAGLVKAAIDFTMSHIKPEAKSNEDFGAASATGDNGAASATGDNGAASATGYKGAASAENKTAIAVAWGVEGRAKGVVGAHIVVSEWKWKDDKYVLLGAKMVQIDGKKYKADTWYMLKNGKIEKAE